MEGLSAVVAGSGNSWAGRAKVRFYLKWRDSALLSMEVEAVGRRRAEGKFLFKWRDSALLSMEVEAVGRRRAEGTFSLFCITSILYIQYSTQ